MSQLSHSASKHSTNSNIDRGQTLETTNLTELLDKSYSTRKNELEAYLEIILASDERDDIIALLRNHIGS